MATETSPARSLMTPDAEAASWDESIIDAKLADAPDPVLPPSALVSPPPTPGWVRRWAGRVGWTIQTGFDLAWWIILMAVITAIPIVQLLAYGYLLRVGGHLAGGGKLAGSIPHLRPAGRIGLAVTFLLVASVPSRLFAHYEAVASIIDPGGPQAIVMRMLAFAVGMAALAYLLWAWARGGRLRHYLWPEPKRMVRESWRPSFWNEAIDRLWQQTVALEIPSTFWLGCRGAIGTLVFLIPAMMMMVVVREGETGLAGLAGVIYLVALGVLMQYLPLLQVHYANENRLRSLFSIGRIRDDFRHAPWAYFLALLMGLVVFPIPLYLLKIEATPREVVWLPCLVFVAFMLPARIAEGLAVRRARRLQTRRLQTRRRDVVPAAVGVSTPEPARVSERSLAPRGIWAAFSRWTCRSLNLAVVAVYLLFVSVSQYTSWDGIATWVQQHAVLIPVPFLSGT